ncbi:MAG: hypothetical protein IIB18_04720 [Chloroflexi bacterium]|nr:hypothetical protein [Chloroflexota bacterium]
MTIIDSGITIVPAKLTEKEDIPMLSLKHRGITLCFAVLIALLLGTAVVQAGGRNNSSMDMNDRFATEMGASGRAVSKVDDGELSLHLVAKGLPTNTALEVHVVVGSGTEFGGDGFFEFDIFPTTSDKNGKIKFDIRGFDLGLPEAGIYRLDFVVLRAGIATPTFDDFLLACEPAPIINFE